MASEDKVTVTFVKSMAQYQAGDSAGFKPERAKALIDAGFAKPYEAPKPEPKKGKASE